MAVQLVKEEEIAEVVVLVKVESTHSLNSYEVDHFMFKSVNSGRLNAVSGSPNH